MTSFLTAGWLLEKLNHRQSNRPAWLIFPRARTQFKCVVAATVSNIHKQIKDERGMYSANRAVQLARAVFNRTKKLKVFDGENPFSDFTLDTETPRSRFLSNEEAAKLI